MKAKFLILAISISLICCEKDQNTTEDFPKTYSLSFELLSTDGSIPENGIVKISSFPLRMVDGRLVGDYEWYGMGKIYTEDNQGNNKILFGSPCDLSACPSAFTSIPFATGAEGRDVGTDEIWKNDKYWLLRYANEDVDTLRIHDVRINNPYTRTFTFFINEQPFESSNFIYDEYSITVQK